MCIKYYVVGVAIIVVCQLQYTKLDVWDQISQSLSCVSGQVVLIYQSEP